MKHFTLILLGLSLLFSTSSLFAQLFTEVYTMGGTDQDYFREIQTDADGNIYAIGVFSGTVSFGSNTLTSGGQLDGFVLKMDKNKKILWINQYKNSRNMRMKHLLLGDDGSVYVGCEYEYDVTVYDQAVGATYISNSSNNYTGDMLLVYFNNDGEFQQSIIGNFGPTNLLTGMALDANGGLYATAILQDSTTNNDGLLVRTQFNGNSIWLRRMVGNQNDGFNDLIIANNRIIAVGYFQDYAEFGSSGGLYSTGLIDEVLAVYDLSGNFLNASHLGSSSSILSAERVLLSSKNHIQVAGIYQGTLNGEASTSGFDLFFQDIDYASSNNTFKINWTNYIHSTKDVTVADIDILGSGDYSVAGTFDGTTKIEGNTVASVSSKDGYIATFSPSDGSFVNFLSCGTANDNDYLFSVATYGDVTYAAGAFISTASFGDIKATSKGSFDGFIATISDYLVACETGERTVCKGDTFTLKYYCEGNFDKTNVFNVEASTTTDFKSTVKVGAISKAGIGRTAINLSNVPAGTNYIRVTSTSPTIKGVQYFTVNVLEQPAAPTIIGKKDPAEFEKDTYSATQNTGSTYSWVIEGGNVLTGQGTNVVEVQWGAEGYGAVNLIETNAGGCPSEKGVLNVKIGTPTAVENAENVDFKVYPTVSHQTVIVQTNIHRSLTIYNAQGKAVGSNTSLLKGTNQISIEALSAGVYYLVLSADNSRDIVKIVKE
ncbi:T9SS type A sorting domain-containing protein [bacterium]|nr:T9SS type A sorting domain-containing protein [bacterium]